MSKRRRRRDREDASDISNAAPVALRSKLLSQILSRPLTRTILQDIEDRREFSPELARPARAFRRAATQLKVGENVGPTRAHQKVRTNKLLVPSNVRFSDPTRVAVCVRRHQRREVLHALRHVGRGSSVRRGKWSEFSDISCKRK